MKVKHFAVRNAVVMASAIAYIELPKDDSDELLIVHLHSGKTFDVGPKFLPDTYQDLIDYFQIDLWANRELNKSSGHSQKWLSGE